MSYRTGIPLLDAIQDKRRARRAARSANAMQRRREIARELDEERDLFDCEPTAPADVPSCPDPVFYDCGRIIGPAAPDGDAPRRIL